MRRHLLSWVLLPALWSSAFGEESWHSYTSRDGVNYEKRAVPGSKFEEYRAILTVAASPERAADAIWSLLSETVSPTIKRRDVLRRTPTELVVYNQIKTPIVSDRDVVLRFQRLPVAPNGRREVRFDAVSDLGPPPDSKFVRLPVVHGTWTITPEGEGSRLSYICYSEPGGSVPATFVRGAQRDQIVMDVQNVLRRLYR